ncbi:uncharacterized oxidoreductase YjmC-like [Lineus longissimus]|uniref:uncharacterized oxidoreductase YjmC-like n=1 Tax=Lineus longissimus TaxID=88925 RepID=UPI002B4CBF0D
MSLSWCRKLPKSLFFRHARYASTTSNEGGILVAKDEAEKYVERCMTSVGTKPEHAKSLAEVLITGDYRSHFSHGLNRLEMYVNDIQSGITVCNLEPVVLKQTAATAYVDGQNLLGPVVGNFCMDIAIKKAREAGIGWVVAKGSNHYGICGWYSIRCADQGFLGMSFTNTSPLSVPTRAKQAVLGTNPLTLAAPAKKGDPFVLDMATSAVALGKIELADRKEMDMPLGWGCDSKGRNTTVPKEALDGGGLLPLGGVENTSGYKGYGLAMMVEIFCGILAGAEYGPNIRKWKSNDQVANLGQSFVAIDPDAFAPGFKDRMADFMEICRGLEPADGETEVLVAGDPERKHMALCDREGGIRYHPNQIKHAIELAARLGVAPLPTKDG